MRKRKALALVAVSAFAVSADIAYSQVSLFTTQGDFGGSSSVNATVDNGFYGFEGGDASDSSLGGGTIADPPTSAAAVNPTAASLAAGQETGWEGFGFYGGAGTILRVDSGGNPNDAAFDADSVDAQANFITFNATSLGNAGGTVNGVGHYANDYSATLYPTTPNASTLPTGPFNTAGSDPNLGKSYAGNTGVSGSMTVQGYEGKTEGEGYDDFSTGEMVNDTAFIKALGTGVTMAIDFTAPGGGTTLTSDGKNASPYYLMSFGTFDSNGGLDTNGAGAGWINPTFFLGSKDPGSFFDDPGSFVVQHGSGASSYWTAYMPYSYTAAMTATYLQFILILNSDGYASPNGGNVTIGNIRTVSPTWAASGSGLSWNQAAIESAGIITTQANWVGAGSNGLGVPSGSGISVTFGDLETGNASVGLDTNQTVGTLIFNSTGDNSSGLPIQYNLTASSTLGTGAGGSLVMDNTANSAPAAINDTSAAVDQFITAPVILNSNTVATVTGAGNTLFFGSAANANAVVVGGISGVGGLTVAGAGTVQLAFADTYTGGTTVNSGATLTASADNALPSGHALVNNGTTNIQGSDSLSSLTGTGKLNISPGSDTKSVVKLAAGSGLATQGGLTIAANSALDIANNHVIIGYAAGTETATDATVRGYLISGRNGGAWNGTTGIISSGSSGTGVAAGYSIGYADGADGVVQVTPANPLGLSTGQIEIKYTLLGDANLDGVVNGDDFTILVGNLGKTVTGWDKGDFLYTGSVTGDDFTALVSNLGKAASGADVAIPAADIAAIDAFGAANGFSPNTPVVPEPASASLLLVASGMLARRGRRRSS